MTSSRHTPIIVGVGDYVNRSKRIEDALEPLKLIQFAITNALEDTGLSAARRSALQSQIDSIDVTATWTWPYQDLPGSIAEGLAVRVRHKHYSEHGDNQPAKLTDDAARRISMGYSKVAIVTGAEALASLTACAAAGKLPPPGWTTPNEDITKVFSPTSRELAPSLGSKHSIGNPIHIYPLYENSFRAHRHQSIDENNAESARLYADFAEVAANNQFSWAYPAPAETEQNIGTVSKRNRMICFPYPLLMNAFNTVNLAAACILTTTEYARELDISEDRWIYPLGGAGTADSGDFWKRPSYWWSPSISKSLDATLQVSSLNKGDIDLYDFYSCFPIVPKLASEHMGLSIAKPEKPITLLGGLTSFGGAGNNYSLHAITEMVRRLRAGSGKTGLVLANGGWLTYQYAICLSKSPRSDGLPYPDDNPLPVTVTDVQIPKIAEAADGDAVIETYTVEFNRDGSPLRGHVVGRLKSNGQRFLANHGDEGTLSQLCSRDIEPIGRSGHVKPAEDGRNLFSFEELAKL